MRNDNKDNLTDKERILLTILDRLQFTQTLCLRGDREEKFKDGNGEYVHFGAYDDRPIQVGDLVICSTGGMHAWKIGWVHQIIGYGECMIREIGSERLCHVSNEKFTRIVGMADFLLLEGDKYTFQQKVKAAFHRGGEWGYRFGGLIFKEDGQAEIWIREVFGGIGKPSAPFCFQMKWDKKTSVKKILNEMLANGYGTRKFEPATDETPKGPNQNRPLTITR